MPRREDRKSDANESRSKSNAADTTPEESSESSLLVEESEEEKLWNASTELVLFSAVKKYPPIGSVQAWNMLSVTARLNKKTGKHFELEQVRSKLEELYNIESLVMFLSHCDSSLLRARILSLSFLTRRCAFACCTFVVGFVLGVDVDVDVDLLAGCFQRRVVGR